MALTDKSSPPAPVFSAFPLPSRAPEFPDDLIKRFPSMQEYADEFASFWRKTRAAWYDAQTVVGTDLSKAVTDLSTQSQRITQVFGDVTAVVSSVEDLELVVYDGADGVEALATRTSALEASVDTPTTGLLARVTTIEGAYVNESEAEAIAASQIIAALTGPSGDIYSAIASESLARASADSALALRTDALEASVDTPTTGLLARVTTIESAYVDASGAEAIAQSEITAALTGPSGSIYAAVEVETNARVAADGLIHARWGVNIDVNGNIVGRINLDGTNASSAFTIDVGKFTVANSSLGVTPFQIVGTKARFTSDVEIDGSLLLTGSLTLAQISDAGALAGEDDVDYSAITGTKPPSNADVTLAAINGGLNVTGTGITLASGSPAIKAGQTAYDTGTGFFLGLASGSPRFSIGNSSGNKLTWDGSTLSIVGNLTLTNTITLSKISDAGALAALNSVNLASGEVTNKSLANLDSAANSKLAGIASGADVTLSAVNGGLSVTGGGINLASGSSALRSGQTGYNTGTGWWLGIASGTPKLSIGNPAGNYLAWDGTNLAIKGSLTLVNTIPAASVSGLAATATSSDYSTITGTKPPSNADVTLSAINGGLSVTGGGLTLSAGGAIKGGASSFNVGTGWFLGYEGGAYKFRVGNPAGARIEWDGSTWNVVSFPGGSAPTYTVTLINNETSNPLYAPTGGGTYTVGQRVNINAITPVEPGSKNFTHWSGADSAVNALDSATASGTYVTVIGDMTLYANYA